MHQARWDQIEELLQAALDLASRLNHPNIITIFESWKWRDGKVSRANPF